MTKLLLLLAALAVGAVVYPRYAEHTDDACGAFAKRLEAMLAAAHAPPPVSYADVANSYLQAQFPQVPAVVRCAVAYWATRFDPDIIETVRRSLAATPPPK
jgi:hypothetical protein